MLALEIDFVARRYHATPWHHQVNEGLVEWPPSPWRLLRAIIAGWYRLNEPTSEPTARALVGKLAGVAPSYEIPRFTEAHTRHYMPTDNKPTLVFDAFVVFDRRESRVRVGYPGVELTSEERLLLERALSKVGYLGRAESWADLRVLELPDDYGFTVVPSESGDPLRLLGALSENDYASWRLATAKTIKSKKWQPPTDLWGALTTSTTELRSARWSKAPGSTWLTYDASGLQPVQRPPMVRAAPRKEICVVKYALRRSGPLPLLTRSIGIANQAHKALAALGDSLNVQQLIGRREQAEASANGHAYLLPVNEARRGRDRNRVTHLYVVLREGGFEPDELQVLERLSRLNLAPEPVELVLEGMWTEAELSRVRPEPPSFRKASVWRSVTPVVLTRYPKVRSDGSPRLDPSTGRWKAGPEDQVRAYLRRLGLPEPLTVESWSPTGSDAYWQRHQRWRERRRVEALPLGHRGFGFRIEFPHEISGPIAIGYASHFGMGLFEPEDDRGR